MSKKSKPNLPAPDAPAPAESASAVRPGGTPPWPFVLLGVLLFGCMLYVEETGGAFRADVYYAGTKTPPPNPAKSPEEALIERGRGVFQTCAACHQASGLGVPGQFPPLSGSEWVTHATPDRIIRLVLNGVEGPMTVKGVAFNGPMVPWRDTYGDEDIAAVITFIRRNPDWKHEASVVTPQQVKAVREETVSRGRTWTADELLKIP